MEERQHTKFEEFFLEDENPPELYPKSRVQRVGIGILLTLLVTTGIGAALYAQQNRDSVSDIIVMVEDYFEQSRIYLSKLSETMGPYLQTTGNYLSDAAVDTDNYFQQSKEYLWQTIKRLLATSQRLSVGFSSRCGGFDNEAVGESKTGPPDSDG